MLMVAAMGTILASYSIMALQPALKNAQADQAYNLTLTTMRRARQLAVDQRKTYIVSFSVPNTLQLLRQDGGTPLPPPVPVSTMRLLNNVQFLNVTGIPTTAATTPDGFGTGARAVDFSIDVGGGGGTSVYFQPDGSAHDAVGNVNNGVVYLARVNDLYSSRAITLFGMSGRSRGWRLVKNLTSGLPVWQSQ
jgi:hypothetical protein